MTTTPSDVELNEDLTLAAAMETWAREHGKGAGFLLLEGARAIRRLSDARGAVIEEAERAKLIEECAKVADREVESWETGKQKLRPIEEVPDAHDRFFNYIENAKSIAKSIRALSHLQPESEKE